MVRYEIIPSPRLVHVFTMFISLSQINAGRQLIIASRRRAPPLFPLQYPRASAILFPIIDTSYPSAQPFDIRQPDELEQEGP